MAKLMLLSPWTLVTDLSKILSTEEAGFSRLQQYTLALLGRTGESTLARMRMRCAWQYFCESVKNLQDNVLGIKDLLVRLLSDVISVALLYRLLPSKNRNQDLVFTIVIKHRFSFRY